MSSKRFPHYVSIAALQAKAEKKLQQLKEKRADLAPVVVKGNSLADTWWGKSWNKNLERYADYRNRIGRGKSYVRHGAVIDLKIEDGQVTALVQGTKSKPYEVVIRITPIEKSSWAAIKNQCQSELRSLPDLLAGNFPKNLGQIFLAEGNGLFPTPQEIDFDCSCPDWASMCKHVAAALYGIGVRLDEDPLLFFRLRQADTEELVKRAVQGKTDELLAKAQKKSAKVIDDADLSGIFGIDLDARPNFLASKTTKSATSNTTRPNDTPPLTDAADTPTTTDTTSRTATEIIESLVIKKKNGVTVEILEKKTGFSRKKIYAITSRLRQQGRITYLAQGVYGKP